jgi:hypothetical protein
MRNKEINRNFFMISKKCDRLLYGIEEEVLIPVR